MTNDQPRSRQQRLADTQKRLHEEVDCWVATADAAGTPYLVPLSHLWDEERLLIATATATPTSQNLLANGKVRVGIGPTRDLVLIEGEAEAVSAAHIPPAIGDAFAVKTGFDPRTLTAPYSYFWIRPLRLQAWREANELAGRDLMRHGEWLTDD